MLAFLKVSLCKVKKNLYYKACVDSKKMMHYWLEELERYTLKEGLSETNLFLIFLDNRNV